MKRWKRPTNEDVAERQRIRAIREAHYASLKDGPVAPAVAPDAVRGPETIVPLAHDDAGRLRTAEPREQQAAVPIPADWESLPYLPRSAGEPCLRALASQVSSVPILNKALAIEAIKAELARRDAAL